MVSFGGYIDYINLEFSLEKLHLDEFDFIRQDEYSYKIDPPQLTYKETLLLNAHLPELERDYLSNPDVRFIPETDRKKYRQLYKYLPNYMDVNY